MQVYPALDLSANSVEHTTVYYVKLSFIQSNNLFYIHLQFQLMLALKFVTIFFYTKKVARLYLVK